MTTPPCGQPGDAPHPPEGDPHRPLIAAEALPPLPVDGLVVVDVSFDLADVDAGERSWQAGHLPGSIYWHLDRMLCGARTGRNGRHPLPDRSTFARALATCGIRPSTFVVAVDRQAAMFAARLWWLMRWMGHPRVAVLDGGVAAWTAAGGQLTTAAGPSPSAAPPYPTDRPPQVATIDGDGLVAQLGRLALIDARAGERFRGEVEPLDAQAGHIPGALNRFFKNNLAADGRFRPAAELRADFDRLLGGRPPADVVQLCGSGVTACHNLLAMTQAGLPGSRLYPGSWSEWSADPARPVARGG